MIGLTLIVTMPLFAAIGWLLVESRTNRLLWFVIPVMLALPFGFYTYGSSLMGYPASVELPKDFGLIHASWSDERREVYVLARLVGTEAPRLYVVRSNFDQNRKAFAEAQGKLARGMPVRGKAKDDGTKNGKPGTAGSTFGGEGDFILYSLPPSEQQRKD